MADRSNYADKPTSEKSSGVMHQHRLVFDSNARAYIPTASERDIDGTRHTIAGDASGDWSWKPARDRAMGYGDESTFRTFRGVAPSAAEQFRGEVFKHA